MNICRGSDTELPSDSKESPYSRRMPAIVSVHLRHNSLQNLIVITEERAAFQITLRPNMGGVASTPPS